MKELCSQVHKIAASVQVSDTDLAKLKATISELQTKNERLEKEVGKLRSSLLETKSSLQDFSSSVDVKLAIMEEGGQRYVCTL